MTKYFVVCGHRVQFLLAPKTRLLRCLTFQFHQVCPGAATVGYQRPVRKQQWNFRGTAFPDGTTTPENDSRPRWPHLGNATLIDKKLMAGCLLEALAVDGDGRLGRAVHVTAPRTFLDHGRLPDRRCRSTSGARGTSEEFGPARSVYGF